MGGPWTATRTRFYHFPRYLSGWVRIDAPRSSALSGILAAVLTYTAVYLDGGEGGQIRRAALRLLNELPIEALDKAPPLHHHHTITSHPSIHQVIDGTPAELAHAPAVPPTRRLLSAFAC